MVSGTLLMPRRRTKAEYTPFGQMIDDLQGNLTDEDLGAQADLSRNQVYLIKTGKSGTTQGSVKKLAIALGIVKRDVLLRFFDLAGYRPPVEMLPPVPELSYELTEEEKREIISSFEGKPPILRRAAMNAVKALLDSLPDPDETTTYGKRDK